MTKNNSFIFYLFLLFMSISFQDSLSDPGRIQIVTFQRESSSEALAKKIQACPAWSEEDIKKMEVKIKIQSCLTEIAEHDITLIREALSKLLSDDDVSTATLSRVFLLNRFLFEVPESSSLDYKIFGGWVGIPIDAGKINRLWPISRDAKGNLIIVGEFGGYFGHRYQALEEFDWFHHTFGLRKKTDEKKTKR